MEYFVSAPIGYGLGCLNPTYFIFIAEPKLVRKHIGLYPLATLIVIFILKKDGIIHFKKKKKLIFHKQYLSKKEIIMR